MDDIKVLSIDIETHSGIPLQKCGVYLYCLDPSFRLLLFGYSINQGEIKVIDIARGDRIPDEIVRAIKSKKVIKTAFNASFERTCLARYLHDIGEFDRECGYDDDDEALSYFLDPVSWRCSQVLSSYNGLPNSLAMVGAVLGFDRQKLEEGKSLINKFCIPHDGKRIMPDDDPKAWDEFKRYNERDVDVEMQINARLQKYPAPDFLWDEYALDQKINDRGVMIERSLAENAVRIDSEIRIRCMERLVELTGLENPNSTIQLRRWLEEHGVTTDSLDKAAVASLLEDAEPDVREVLTLKQQISKSSVKKYEKMLDTACPDGWVRGMFQFYGAARTGRFSGKGVQLQNLPRNVMDTLDTARNIVLQNDIGMLDLMYDSPSNVLSELIRTAFRPRDGYVFHVSDFTSIEAVVIANLAGEKWRIAAFEAGKDIYCESASRIYHCEVVKHGVNGHLRAKGKVAELACGYGGGVNAMMRMDSEGAVPEEELQSIVDQWRAASPNIVKLWKDVGDSAELAIRGRKTMTLRNLKFTYRSGALFITLPSGRDLVYAKPEFVENRFGGISIAYWGLDSTKKWSKHETYGAKLVENIVQGISRDILCFAMRNLKDCRICMHIHDEVVAEVPEGSPKDIISSIMTQTPPWMPGLKLRAEEYECDYYMKD